MDGPRFDLVLTGFRNDIARERVLQLLLTLNVGLPAVERDTKLPLELLSDIDHETGLRLSARLREAGAVLKLVAVAEPSVLKIEQDLSTPPRKSRAGLPALFCLLALLFFIRSVGSQQVALMPAGGVGNALRLNELNADAVSLNEGGEYREAMLRLRTAIELDPNQPTLRSNLKTVLNNLAIAELNAERPQEAIEFAEESLSLDEHDGAALAVVGFARFKGGDLGGAKEALEESVRLGHDNANTLMTLGNVYRQMGDREEAVAMLQRARDKGAGDQSFHKALRKMERELDAEWDFSQLTSPHFEISFAEGKNAEAAQIVLRELEDAYLFVGAKLDFHPTERTSVVLYTKAQFHDITETPDWAGGAFDGRIKLPVQGLTHTSAALRHTLRHEYAHVLIGQLSHGRVPVWLNEGIAIWCEQNSSDEKVAWAKGQIAGYELFPLHQMLRPFAELPSKRVPVAYSQSFLAVHRLVELYGANRLYGLLAKSAEASDFNEAFRQIYPGDLAIFETDLLRDLTS